MQTTILGILTLIGAVVSGATQFLKGGSIDFISIAPAISAGIGLIRAQDQRQ